MKGDKIKKIDLDEAEFKAAVRNALQYLWTPSHLKKSPLLDLKTVRSRAEHRTEAVTPTHLIQALQDIVREAIDTLKPQDEQVQPEAHRWRTYCLLHYRYWEELAANTIAAKLYISRRTFYRELSEAIRQLADILHDMEHEVEGHIATLARWAEAIPSLRSFCGRAQELADYQDQWNARHLIVIEGLAGIGKTSLGAELVRQYVGRKPAFWYTFRQGLNDDINSVLLALAAFLARQGNDRFWRFLSLSREDTTPRPLGLKIAYLLSSLETDQYVLCFDDFHVVNEDAPLRSLFEELQESARAARLSLLIISRHPPAFVKELVCPPLEGFNPADARQLVEQAGLPHLSDDLFGRLYEKTGGNPQLLNLFIAWAMEQESLDGNLLHFVNAMPTAREVHHYLLHNVYNSLEPQEQKVVKALALLRPPTEHPAIEAILNEQESKTVKAVLGSLARKHVIEEHTGEKNALFFHATIREFCYSLLEESVRIDWHGRAADYFASVGNHIEAAYHYLNAGSHDRCAQTLARHHETLINQGQSRPMLEILSRLDQTELTPEQWLEVSLAAGETLIHTAAYEEAISRLQAALYFPDLSKRQQALILHKLSWIHEILGNMDQAVLYAQQGMDLFENQVKPEPETGLLLDSLAWVYYRQGTYQQAYELICRAVDVLETSAEYPKEMGRIYRARGMIALALGDPQQAKADTQRGLSISKQIGHTSGIAMTLNNLGVIATHERELEIALEHFEQSLALREEIGDTYGQCLSCHNIGEIHLRLEHSARGREYLERALAIATDMGMRQVLAPTLVLLAEIEATDENYQAALKRFHQALEIAEADGYRDCVANCQRGTAKILLHAGDYDQALNDAQRSLQIAREMDDPSGQAQGNKVLGQILLAQGEHQRARTFLQDGLEIARTHALEKVAVEIEALLPIRRIKPLK